MGGAFPRVGGGGRVACCRVDVYGTPYLRVLVEGYQENGTVGSSDKSVVSGDDVEWGGTTVYTGSGDIECLSGCLGLACYGRVDSYSS